MSAKHGCWKCVRFTAMEWPKRSFSTFSPVLSDFGGRIQAGRHQRQTVGRKFGGQNRLDVSFDRHLFAPRSRIPPLHNLIAPRCDWRFAAGRSRCEPTSIGRKVYSAQRVFHLSKTQRQQHTSRRHCPHACEAVRYDKAAKRNTTRSRANLPAEVAVRRRATGRGHAPV